MFTLSSPLHHEKLSLPFTPSEKWVADNQVVAVLTGGTEQQFLQLVLDHQLDLQRPIYIMASGNSNSLAASLEILSWIQQHGGTGRVVTSAEDTNQTKATSILCTPEKINGDGLRLGVIGHPSDWLIASGVDYDLIYKKTGIEMVDIPISEVVSLGPVDGGLEGAEIIYRRLLDIVDRYHLNGLTLRCFDLLTTVCNTGCLALSYLNDAGIPSSCEGDIPLLLTMMLARQRYHCPSFQVNPAQIYDDGRILLAHCTVPLTMTTCHSFTTHFESGIGIGIHGDLPLGEYRLMKLSPDLSYLLNEKVELTANQFLPNLCRTQVWVKGTPQLSRQLLSHPIANHLLLVHTVQS